MTTIFMVARAIMRGYKMYFVAYYLSLWGCSSVGRALAWHVRGRRFNPDQLHQKQAEKEVL